MRIEIFVTFESREVSMTFILRETTDISITTEDPIKAYPRGWEQMREERTR